MPYYRRNGSESPTPSELPDTPPPTVPAFPNGRSLLSYIIERFGLVGSVSMDESKVKTMDGELARIFLLISVKILRELPWVNNRYKGRFGDSLLDDILLDMGVGSLNRNRSGYSDEDIFNATHEDVKINLRMLFRHCEKRDRPDIVEIESALYGGHPIKPNSLQDGGEMTEFDRRYIRKLFAKGTHLPDNLVVGTSEQGQSACEKIFGPISRKDKGVSGPPVHLEYVPFAPFELLRSSDMHPRPYLAVAYGREVGLFSTEKWGDVNTYVYGLKDAQYRAVCDFDEGIAWLRTVSRGQRNCLIKVRNAVVEDYDN
ncbi:hypothetical protein SCHPADRAFT_947555 [Schizopora paradoxa]|uniref:Uncharacterized protein n=1 Tax=Schizopora paradoxa TaxID=27342 RepID=A0A0H2R586_9AGAM|nr:hypothetical protein SCHPADRAFT_947555 [Schizopora paradoxa]